MTATIERTLVCWDIDGTLNVHGRTSRWSGDWILEKVTREEIPALFEMLPERITALDLRVNQSLLDSIAGLQNSPHVENAWLTAWEQEARTVFSPRVNFPQGEDWLSFSAPTGSFSLEATGNWWKTTIVREFLKVNPNTRIIWVDDLLDENETVEKNNQLLVNDFSERLALVGVPPHVGVTPDSFNFIKRLAIEKWESGMFIFEG